MHGAPRTVTMSRGTTSDQVLNASLELGLRAGDAEGAARVGDDVVDAADARGLLRDDEEGGEVGGVARDQNQGEEP